MTSFFEGPEKKFELVLREGHASLRRAPEELWRDVIGAARAHILGRRASEHIDAFLLSESSLFVADRRLTMITCGRTTLVGAIERALAYIDLDAVSLLVYERKNEHRPELQASSFDDDAQRLTRWVPGRVVRFGSSDPHGLALFHSKGVHTPEPGERTLEVLMHGIEPAVASKFVATAEPRFVASAALTQTLAGYDVHEHLFDPVGYSFNALRGDSYAALHVTPEPHGSYASFETNDHELELTVALRELIELFRPEAFELLSFDGLRAPRGHVTLTGYRHLEESDERVSGYSVRFLRYVRIG
ncbi:MAG: hypothetical protein AB7S26_01450 [Sandaracinaceae bacterium]